MYFEICDGIHILPTLPITATAFTIKCHKRQVTQAQEVQEC